MKCLPDTGSQPPVKIQYKINVYEIYSSKITKILNSGENLKRKVHNQIPYFAHVQIS